MITFLTILHVVVALILIVLVLVQDSKGGGALGMGSGSNSILGATGAQTLAATLTKGTAIVFALTCISLAAMVGSRPKSVIDALPPASPTNVTPEVAPNPTKEKTEQAPNQSPEATSPSKSPAPPSN